VPNPQKQLTHKPTILKLSTLNIYLSKHEVRNTHTRIVNAVSTTDIIIVIYLYISALLVVVRP
jgi:hypothetical protein